MPTVVNDTFTDTNAVLLDAHTGETGASWTKHPLSAAPVAQHINNRIRNGGTNGAYYASGVPASADQDIQGVYRVVTLAGISIGITGRMSTSALTYYMARLNSAAGGTLELYKFVAAASTLLTSAAYALTATQDYTVKLELRDATKKVYVNGVEILSSNDNVITASGRAGVRTNGTDTDATGIHLDSLTATDFPAAGFAGWGIPL